MLKHKDIIEKMSVKQKIALLTNINCLSEHEYTALGIPYMSFAKMEDLLSATGEGISSNILARSWNTEGIQGVTEELVGISKSRGVNFVFSPSPKIKINPYMSAISEDPYLSGELVGAYLNAIHKKGISACVSDMKLEDGDVNYLDLEPNTRVLHDYFVSPYKIAVERGDCHSIIASLTSLEKGYSNVNRSIMHSAENGIFDREMNVLCDEHTPEATAEIWHNGGIVMSGVPSVLEHAYEKYNQIIRAIHQGHATVNDLEDAYADGSAISDDMLDAAVSRVIDFAFMCDSEFNKSSEVETSYGYDFYGASDPLNESYASTKLLGLIKESIVLLKNDKKILPLNPNSTFAVIGDYALSDKSDKFVSTLTSSMDNTCIGVSRGYELNGDKNEALISDAVALSSEADTVLLFLGIDAKRLGKLSTTKHLELPANQAALLNSLKQYSHKIVAIISGDVLPGAALDNDAAATILAPVQGTLCARALADVVSGRYNPSGRLTESYYDSPDVTYENVRKNKDHKFNKIGPFMGYRNYDSSMQQIRYPFGYGLSYTKFEYSNLVISGMDVSFTVRNSGIYQGCETVQLYVGKRDSQFIRPLKELKAFKKIDLAPNEAKSVKLTLSDLSVYDESEKKSIFESGKYQVYVGSSVSDIHLSADMTISGSYKKSESGKNEKKSDYLLSESNILLDKYTLESRGQYMKRSNKWMISYVMGIIVTVIVNAMLIATKIGASDNIRLLGRSILGVIVIFNIFAITFIVFAIIADSISLKKFRMMSAIEDNKVIKNNFADAKALDEINIDDLFVKEFDDVCNVEKDVAPRRGFDLSDYSRFVDEEMNFVVAQQTLEKFASKHGVKFDNDFSGNILASFATSRLLLLNSSDYDEVRHFSDILCDYFGTEAYFEEIDSSYIDGNLIARKSYEGSWVKTSVYNMIKSASERKDKIHFVTLNGLTPELLTNLFSRYIRFINNPERECVITVNDERFTIPENVWFLVSMNSSEEKSQNIPVYLAELMTSIDFSHMETIPSFDSYEQETQDISDDLQHLGYYQLSFMSEKSKNGFALSESLWKKVDSLEEYANKHSSYRFGNKVWLRLEKYLSVLNSCNFEPKTALDYTLNSNIIFVLQVILEGKLADDDRGLLEALEIYFGEDNIPACRNTLKGKSLTQD